MSKYWSRGIAGLEAYVPGEQPQGTGWIKLNSNENPYPPSPRVIEAIKAAAEGGLRLYPDPDCMRLREAIAAHFGLSREEVFAGNGSDEILAFAFAAFFDQDEPLLFPDITYSFYPVYARFFRLRFETIPVSEDFGIPVEKFLRANGGVIISNPNAPTSLFLPLREVRRILEHNLAIGKVVVLDEAYIDFGGDSAAGLVGEYPNLLVVQTLSKSRSLAGLRVGFAVGQRDLVEGLERVKSSFNSYTLDRLALAGAVEAMNDEGHFRETREKIIATRDRVARELEGLGFSVLDSKTNFLLIGHPRAHASSLYRGLRENKILVRYFDRPRIDDRLRVSVGTDAEMDAFLDAVRKLVM